MTSAIPLVARNYEGLKRKSDIGVIQARGPLEAHRVGKKKKQP